MKHFFNLLFLFCALCLLAGCADKEKKTIIFAYGNSVHLWGDHENKLMSEVLSGLINESTPYKAYALDAGDKAFKSKAANADAVIIISEGESHHPFRDGAFALISTVKNLGAYHYALDFSSKDDGQKLRAKTGGIFEQNWSVNPFFEARFEVAEHPVSKGVKPFEIYDEWYFNMRFQEEGGRVTEILKTIPPDHARKRSLGTHTGNKFVRENLGRSETVLWVYEKDDGSRGMGFTGGHSIFTLYNPELRKLLLNSAVWLAHGEIPPGGFDSQMPPFDELAEIIKKDKRADYDSYIKRWRP